MLFCFRKYSQEIAQLVLNGSIIECKVWEDSATIVTSINSGEMFCPCNKKLILHMARVCIFCPFLSNALVTFIIIYVRKKKILVLLRRMVFIRPFSVLPMMLNLLKNYCTVYFIILCPLKVGALIRL